MKKTLFLISTATAAIVVAGSALAADMAVRPLYKAPPLPAAYNWTGWYIGANAGWVGSDNQISNSVSPTPDATLGVVPGVSEGLAALAAGGIPVGKGNGFIGGGQLGYNQQFGNIVAGLEADIQGLSNSGGSGSTTNQAVVVGALITSTQTASMSTKYLGTVRGRLGFLAAPSFLVYGTGGLAYGGVNASTSLAQTGTNGFIGNGATTLSDTRTGWAAGAGVEWMFAQNWSAKAEYLHYDLGTATFAGSASSSTIFVTPVYQTTVSSAQFKGDTVRAGVNLHF
jgi:outer membrane immunogenic protein